MCALTAFPIRPSIARSSFPHRRSAGATVGWVQGSFPSQATAVSGIVSVSKLKATTSPSKVACGSISNDANDSRNHNDTIRMMEQPFSTSKVTGKRLPEAGRALQPG